MIYEKVFQTEYLMTGNKDMNLDQMKQAIKKHNKNISEEQLDNIQELF